MAAWGETGECSVGERVACWAERFALLCMGLTGFMLPTVAFLESAEPFMLVLLVVLLLMW